MNTTLTGCYLCQNSSKLVSKCFRKQLSHVQMKAGLPRQDCEFCYVSRCHYGFWATGALGIIGLFTAMSADHLSRRNKVRATLISCSLICVFHHQKTMTNQHKKLLGIHFLNYKRNVIKTEL